MHKGSHSFIKITVELIVGKWPGSLVERVGKPHNVYIRKMLLQDIESGLKMEERIVDGHGEITRCIVFDGGNIEFRSQYFGDLRIQNGNCAFGYSGKLLFQRDRPLQAADLLQDLYHQMNRLPVVDQFIETPLDAGDAQESIEIV